MQRLANCGARRPGQDWLPVLLLFALGNGQPTATATAAHTSADYALNHESIAPAGRHAASHDYTLEAQLDDHGSTGGSTDVLFRSGFIGQLSEPPVVETDLAYLGTGTRLKVNLAALLRNDHDAEGDALTFAGFNSASAEGGSVTLEGGWLVYQAPVGFTGTDTLIYRLTDASGEESSGFVLVQAQPDTGGVSFNIIAADELPGGAVRIRCVGIPGRTYAVQASDSLASPIWSTISTPAAAANGRFEAIDADAPLHPLRYYRTLEP